MSEKTVEVSYVSKMSVKTLKCDPRLEKGVEKQVLCRIYGLATGTKVKEDKVTGQIWTPLVGEFEGVNIEDGSIYRSGVLYLPNGIHEVIESAVTKLKDPENAGVSVQFALEISSVKANNKIGYSYEAKNLVKADVADPLEQLRAMLPTSNQKSLSAGAKK